MPIGLEIAKHIKSKCESANTIMILSGQMKKIPL
jgi:hypothetical protein